MKRIATGLSLALFTTLVIGCGSGGGGNGTGASVQPTPHQGGGTVAVSPDEIQFLAVPSTTVVTASESGYTGQFTAKSIDTTVATVTSGPGTDQFTIAAVAAGFTFVDVSDTAGSENKVAISVTTTSVGGN